jgi:hypothetical protein
MKAECKSAEYSKVIAQNIAIFNYQLNNIINQHYAQPNLSTDKRNEMLIL